MKKENKTTIWNTHWHKLTIKQKRNIVFIILSIVVVFCVLIRLVMMRRPWTVLPIILLLVLIYYPIIKSLEE
jgi:cell division protein FtsW (lipid II flippase)